MSLMLTRRQMIESLGGGLGVVGLASLFGSLSKSSTLHAAGLGNYPGALVAPKAKHVIMLYMNGGPSQLDMFDPKPALFKYAGQRPSAVDLRTERVTSGLLPSPFEFKRYGRNGVEVSELLPQLASVIDDVCVIRSMYTFSPTHTPGRALFHTGSVLATRPSMGSWVTYGLGSENENLPAFVALGNAAGGGPQNRSGFLPTEYQGIGFAVADPDPEKIIPNLRNKYVGKDAQRVDMDALLELNRAHAKSFGADQYLEGRIKSMESAYRMQFEALELFDIRKEPEHIREEYGTGAFGNGCLLARRLVEAGVRYINVDYPGGQIWDDHRDVNDNLRKRCPDMDQGAAALIRDLKRRGLLDETLVVWGGEFGRTPVSESGSGRDHNPYGFTMFVAGGGFKGGIAYGATDEFGFKAEQNRVSIHDLHATLLNQLGMDHTKLTYRYAGRDFRLTDVSGEIVRDILVRLIACALAVFCVAVARLPAQDQEDAKSRKTVRDPVYTAAQAERGKQVYDANCVTCHLPDLDGSSNPTAGARGAPLVGTRFVQDFGESKVSALFNKMKRDMPSGRPGTLTDQEYFDVATFVLQKNRFPAGSAELTADMADTVWIPGAGGGEGLQNYTFVSSVGCLYQIPTRSWLLTNAEELKKTEPSAAADADPSAAKRPRGEFTFRLLDAISHNPEPHNGHKVRVIGHMVRLGAEIRVNVTSLQMVGASCGN